MSKKFWRSGMIDRRVVAEKEWHEHINEIKMAMIESYRERYVVKHGNNKLYYFNLADDYDEVRKVIMLHWILEKTSLLRLESV